MCPCTTCGVPCRRWIPRKAPNADADARNLARDAILQSFYALRETFLEELDLEAPDHPLLISGGRRGKTSGATRAARRAQDRQQARQDRVPSPDPRIDTMLADLNAREQTTAKPWRQPAADAPGALAQRPWRVMRCHPGISRAATISGTQGSQQRRCVVPWVPARRFAGAFRCREPAGMTARHRPGDVNTGSCLAACFFCSTLSAACAALIRRAMANKYSITSVGSSAVAYRSGW